MNASRVVVGGATGFMGTYLVDRYRRVGREVVTISRSGADVHWGDAAGIAAAVDGAGLVVGLAGKSVSCRYTPEHRAAIFSSRLATTGALSAAIKQAQQPPPVWINSSTATIYRHAEDRPMTEAEGELGTGFSVSVAKAWEQALFADELEHTRRVALRTAIVLGDGGVLGPLRKLARIGLGGAQHDGWWPVSAARRTAGTAHLPGARRGAQRCSWVHIEDACRAIDFIESSTLDGPVNVVSPNVETNASFMRALRQAVGARVHVPMPRWMLEVGAIGIGTETELILKSRWAEPKKLTDAGFSFAYPTLDTALRDICASS